MDTDVAGSHARAPIGMRHRFLKRSFDVIASATGLICTSWLILLAWAVMTVDTRQNGLFTQLRVGRGGKLFRIFKIRTMRTLKGVDTTVTTRSDPRLTPIGRIMRKLKIDELPQLWNVLRGDMSFVGPRPDVPGFADRLTGSERIILSMRPGITGPATLHFRNEEQLLADQDDPENYNREVLFPTKIAINVEYIRHYTFMLDMRCIWATLSGGLVPGIDVLADEFPDTRGNLGGR